MKNCVFYMIDSESVCMGFVTEFFANPIFRPSFVKIYSAGSSTVSAKGYTVPAGNALNSSADIAFMKPASIAG